MVHRLQVRKLTYLLLMIVSLMSVSASYAQEELVVAVGLSKPPYVIQKSNKGFEIDLIRNVFSKMGYKAKFVYTTFGHSSKMLDVQEVGAVMTTNKSVFKDESKLSDDYITYQNVAISLKENNFTINSIKELGNYSMASFQKADQVLGADFANAVDRSPYYLKIADQKQQPILLMRKRVEILVMDKNIFKYLIKQIRVNDVEDTFNFHPVFPQTHYKMAFKNIEHTKSFNKELKAFRRSTEYQTLRNAYDL